MDTPDTHTPPSTPGSEPRTSYLEEKAFKARTLLVFGTITDTLAADVARRLIALDAERYWLTVTRFCTEGSASNRETLDSSSSRLGR